MKILGMKNSETNQRILDFSHLGKSVATGQK